MGASRWRGISPLVGTPLEPPGLCGYGSDLAATLVGNAAQTLSEMQKGADIFRCGDSCSDGSAAALAEISRAVSVMGPCPTAITQESESRDIHLATD